jgi:hypothetical protein
MRHHPFLRLLNFLGLCRHLRSRGGRTIRLSGRITPAPGRGHSVRLPIATTPPDPAGDLRGGAASGAARGRDFELIPLDLVAVPQNRIARWLDSPSAAEQARRLRAVDLAITQIVMPRRRN